MPRELCVLEHDGLLRLIEHRCKLDVRGELAVDIGSRALEPRLPFSGAPPEESIEESHATNAVTTRVGGLYPSNVSD